MNKLSFVIIFFLTAVIGSYGKATIEESLLKDAGQSIDKATRYLLQQQAENGSWGNEPAITALAMQALHKTEHPELNQKIDDAVEKGREFILDAAQSNGSFVGNYKDYVNYTTSVCLSALAMLDKPEDKEVMRDARHFLLDLQLKEDHPEIPLKPGNPFYGGIGYASEEQKIPDLSNTQFALEALYLTNYLDRDTKYAEEGREAFKRAQNFLRSVQNIPEDIDKDWEPDPDSEINGGFVYRPYLCLVRGQTANEFEGRPISYGATTFGGLKSLLYAEVEKDDPRVQAAVNWIKRHYTLEENPVMGKEGYYFYLWTFAKAMEVYGEETLKLNDGTTRHWRSDLISKLVELQNPEGYWVNEKTGRYLETIPELVTSYSLIAMQVAIGEEDVF